MNMPLKTSVEMEEKIEARKEKREQVIHPVYPDPTLLFRMEKGAKYFGLIMHSLKTMFKSLTFHLDEDEAWIANKDPTGVFGLYLTLKIENLAAYVPTEELISFELWKHAEILKHVKKGEPLEVWLHGNLGSAILKMKRGKFKLSLVDEDEFMKLILREKIHSMEYPSEFMSKGADWKMAIKTFALFKPENIHVSSDGENVFLRVVADDLSNDEGEIQLAMTKTRLEVFDWAFSYNALSQLLDFFSTDMLVKVNDKGALIFHVDAHAFRAVIMMAGVDDDGDDFEDDGEFDDI